MNIDSIQDELLKLLNKPFDESVLCQANSEAWFSNELAWLLDPKGSHGLGVKFAQAFVAMLGEKRSEGNGYRRRNAYLKKGKSRHGTGVTSF